MRISRITVAFGVWIVVSAAFMRQLVDLFRQAVGPTYAALSVKLLLLALGLAVTYLLVLRREVDTGRLAALSVLTTFAFLYISGLSIVVEKIHVIEYAVLGWLLCRDLTREGKVLRGIMLACLACLLVGALDEAFQAVLPYRVFDWLDIRHNMFGGAEGVAIYLLAER